LLKSFEYSSTLPADSISFNIQIRVSLTSTKVSTDSCAPKLEINDLRGGVDNLI